MTLWRQFWSPTGTEKRRERPCSMPEEAFDDVRGHVLAFLMSDWYRPGR